MSFAYEAQKYYSSRAKTMASNNNAGAALIVTDLKPSDGHPDLLELTLPHKLSEGRLKTASLYSRRRSTQVVPGKISQSFDFNTLRYLQNMGFVFTTVEGAPDVHTGAIRTSMLPSFNAHHIEFENQTSAQDRRFDISRLIGETLRIECSESAQLAKQTLTESFGYWLGNKTGTSAGDLAEPTALEDTTEDGIVHFPWMWHHFSLPTFTYNAETIEGNIYGWWIEIKNINNKIKLPTEPATDIINFSSLAYKGIEVNIGLRIEPYGMNLFELNETSIENYATDLDLAWKFLDPATADHYTQGTHDKMELVKMAYVREGPDFEIYDIVLHQDSTGSFVPKESNGLNNDWYLNP